MGDEIDSLTRLPGSGPLLARLDEELARSERFGLPVSLLLVSVPDLDCLAAARGRDAVDMVLRRMALLCLSAVREADFVARVSADTFALLLMDTYAAEAEETAARLRRTVAGRDLSEDETPLFVAARVEVATYEPDRDDAGALPLRVRQALAAAREPAPVRAAECGVGRAA